MLFNLPKDSIQLRRANEEQGLQVDLSSLLDICLKAILLHIEKGITLVITHHNLFYEPNQKTFKLVPIFDGNFLIYEEIKLILKRVIKAQLQHIDMGLLERLKELIQLDLKNLSNT